MVDDSRAGRAGKVLDPLELAALDAQSRELEVGRRARNGGAGSCGLDRLLRRRSERRAAVRLALDRVHEIPVSGEGALDVEARRPHLDAPHPAAPGAPEVEVELDLVGFEELAPGVRSAHPQGDTLGGGVEAPELETPVFHFELGAVGLRRRGHPFRGELWPDHELEEDEHRGEKDADGFLVTEFADRLGEAVPLHEIEEELLDLLSDAQVGLFAGHSSLREVAARVTRRNERRAAATAIRRAPRRRPRCSRQCDGRARGDIGHELRAEWLGSEPPDRVPGRGKSGCGDRLERQHRHGWNSRRRTVDDCSLREAIAAADDFDTISFTLPGSPPWQITLNPANGQLSIVDDLQISGPGALSLVVSGNGAMRILTIEGGTNVFLSGLTFRDGHAASDADPHGGCLQVLGNAFVGLSRFEGCEARTLSGVSELPGGDGGAIYVAASGFFTGVELSFSGNSAGGGASSGLFPGGGKGGRGGALANSGSATLLRSTFFGSSAGNGGEPTGSGGEGGAIANLGGVLTVTSSTLAENHSGDGADPVAKHGTDGHGGALWCQADCALNNVTLSGNTIGSSSVFGMAASGGGLAVGLGVTRLRNVTVAGNTANGTGGGIARIAGEIRTQNSVFSENSGAGDQADCTTNDADSLVSEGWNWIRVNDGCATSFSGTDTEGTSGMPSDPMLGTLGPNGGPTETRALLSGSEAIDGGDPNGCQAWDGIGNVPMGEDQRGFMRPTDGDGDLVNRCDIGAYEAAEAPPLEYLLEVSLAGAPGGGSVTSNFGGIDCPDFCSAFFTLTSTVELTAEASPGHLFMGWSGDCSGTGDCSVAMSSNRLVTATFAALFDLNVTLAGLGSGR